jgi:hypothetical protein
MDQYYMYLKLAAETGKTLKNLSSQLHVQNIATIHLKQSLCFLLKPYAVGKFISTFKNISPPEQTR